MAKDTVKKSKAEFEGQVVSDKMDKTRVIEIHTRKIHPKYKKTYTVVRKFVAHDENNEYHTGDVVKFIPAKPYSKTKKFIITSRGQISKKQAAVAAEAKAQASIKTEAGEATAE